MKANLLSGSRRTELPRNAFLADEPFRSPDPPQSPSIRRDPLAIPRQHQANPRHSHANRAHPLAIAPNPFRSSEIPHSILLDPAPTPANACRCFHDVLAMTAQSRPDARRVGRGGRQRERARPRPISDRFPYLPPKVQVGLEDACG
jgi:hypothetical protein